MRLRKPELSEAPEAFKTNTGFRFISKSDVAFKITIPRPHGGYLYRTVGLLKLGEEKALRRAIKERDQLGKGLWGKFWSKIISDYAYLSNLPKNLEPMYFLDPADTSKLGEYRANWIENVDGKKCKVARRYRVNAHGKLGAYMLAKKELQEAYKDKLELLKFMGRNSALTIK
ncbi:Fe3+-citrate ABC transporter substrate-binding protein [Vibrio vulnificus]|nr:Fe3+-citrate ABC transporter substrate-binding protein [Vibrio vulnificus]